MLREHKCMRMCWRVFCRNTIVESVMPLSWRLRLSYLNMCFPPFPWAKYATVRKHKGLAYSFECWYDYDSCKWNTWPIRQCYDPTLQLLSRLFPFSFTLFLGISTRELAREMRPCLFFAHIFLRRFYSFTNSKAAFVSWYFSYSLKNIRLLVQFCI